MVLDPISALGFTCNLLQLIDVSIKLVSKARSIHVSSNGALIENTELEVVAKDLAQLSDHTAADSSIISAPPSGRFGAFEDTFKELSQRCGEVAGELLMRLEKLKVEGKHRGWKSFRQALKSVWTKEEINAIASRLTNLRAQLDSRILFSLRSDINIIALRQSEVFDSLDSSTKTIIKLLQQHYDSLEQSQSCANKVVRIEHDRTRDEIINAINRSREHGRVQNLQYPVTHLSAAYESAVRVSATTRILDSLTFRSIEDRHDEIAERHKETFEWIYEESQADEKRWGGFVKWLREGNGTFWIAGKAGSGKSTLMKYLYNDPRTGELLKFWAGNLPLLVTSFFFWSVGTDLQKSMIGLLRSLLYQVVRDYKALIPILFAERLHEYQQDKLTSEEWSEPELARAFRRLVSQEVVPAKFCFLIDGLDEYDGDHAAIVELLKSIPQKSSIKVCASSRPLIVFDDAFSQGSMIMLQHLTFSDIKCYVTNKIGEHATTLQLQEDDLEFPRLITEIVERASGVFLWVKLVVRSLLDGLSNGDGVSDLQTRLRLLPTDLEKLYTHMMKQVEPIYRGQAWKLFRIVRKSTCSLTPLELFFADEKLQYAIDIKPELLEFDAYLTICKLMARRLKSRCKGLLEIQFRKDNSILADVEAKDHQLLDSKVMFLHKTVEDFLEQQDTKSLFGIQAHEELKLYNPSVCLITSKLLTLKVLVSPKTCDPANLEGLMANFFSLVFEAIKTDEVSSETLGAAMESFDETLSRHTLCVRPFSDLPLAGQLLRVKYIRGSNYHEDYSSSLTLAIQFNLEESIERKLDEYHASTQKQSRPLLDYALFLRRRWQCRGADPPINRDIVSLLLERGADPNECYRGASPWQNALSYICLYENLSEGTQVYSNQWLTAFKLLLEHGADPNAHYQHKGGCHISMTERGLSLSYSALDIIITRFPVSTERLELEALIKQKQNEWLQREQSQNGEKQQSNGYETQTQDQLQQSQPKSQQRQIESRNLESSKKFEGLNWRMKLSRWIRKMKFWRIRIGQGV